MNLKDGHFKFSRQRFQIVVLVLLAIVVALLVRLVYLAETDKGFLLSKGNAQSIHYFTIPANRGAVLDRNGISLAVSAPIVNIVFAPRQMLQSEDWKKLANNPVIGLNYNQLNTLLKQHARSMFMYVKKGVPPSQAQAIIALKIPGVYLQSVPQTFYPSANAAAQLVGFTDNNDQGQDGLELSYNRWLHATNGKEQVLETALGQILGILDVIQQPENGKDLTLSIDSRIQYIAYDALKQGVETTLADSGSAVVIDPHTGEVLAAVSYPSFNPNDVHDRVGSKVKDRAITDSYEPGSVAKPFTIAIALESGKYTPNTVIDTSPGYYFLQGHRIRDDANFGVLNVTGVLQKSSNVGISKIALSLPHDLVYNMLVKAGFNALPSNGAFPGETRGIMHPLAQLGDFEYATMTFGYAFSISTLQLARAYAAIANGGVICPASYIKLNTAPADCQRIMSAQTSKQIMAMLSTVTQAGGTGVLANIPGFDIAAKTGTSHQAAPHGYYANRYNSQFVGIVPMNDPQLVIAVHLDNPKGYFYSFGGHSAGPIFAQIAMNSLRVLGVGFTQDQINQSIFKLQQAIMRENGNNN